jgi:hypothetical protein
MPEQEERIRTIAGYLLKNNARLILNASAEVAQFVKVSVLQAFTDPSIMIRNAAGQDIVAFLGTLEPRNWPECLQQLVVLLDSPDFDRQEVSQSLQCIMEAVWQDGLECCGAACRCIHETYYESSRIRAALIDRELQVWMALMWVGA